MSPWGTSSLLSSRQDTYIVENLPKVVHSPALVFHANANIFLAAEDNLNISLKDITVTGRDGRVSQLDQVYIRGSMVRFFIVPDMLQNAPMYAMQSFRATSTFDMGMPRFKRVGPNAMRGRGIGTARGRATIMRGLLPVFLQIDGYANVPGQPMVPLCL